MYSFESECQNKRRYWDRREAKRAAKETGKTLRSKMDPYRCDHCGQWHIGHRSVGSGGQRHTWSNQGRGDSIHDGRAFGKNTGDPPQV